MSAVLCFSKVLSDIVEVKLYIVYAICKVFIPVLKCVKLIKNRLRRTRVRLIAENKGAHFT